MLDACCCLLTYIADVFSCLPSMTQNARATSPPWEGESPPDVDTDWADDIAHEDEDSSAEDSVSIFALFCATHPLPKHVVALQWNVVLFPG